MTPPNRISTADEFTPDGFFVFRTPLLPFEEVERWSEGLAAPAVPAGAAPEELAAAVAADRRLLRERLTALLARPEVLEAVFVASPSLVDGLEIWKRDPESKKGQRAERALVRYFLRMASRPTPFGLFSGCSTADLAVRPEASPAGVGSTAAAAPQAASPAGAEATSEAAPQAASPAGAAPDPAPAATQLSLPPRNRYQRHTRLDMDYLFALCEELERSPEMRRELRYRPNSSLYRAAGRLRYAEARLDNKVRSHHLVAVEASDYLEATLERARGGALAADLAAALVTQEGADAGLAADPDLEITREEADAFITELIDSQVLVSDLSPPVTGPEAIHDLVDHLAGLEAGQAAAGRLAAARDVLAALDAGGPGASPEPYRAIAADLGSLPTPVEMARLFQVDMVKPPAAAGLGGAVLDEVARGLDLLRRIAGRARQESLEKFRRDFQERYGEQREVPLVEVLDEEIGIGFERSSEVGAEASPLLRGLALGAPPSDPSYAWGTRQALLLAKLHEAQAAGAQQIELTAEDLDKMVPPAPGEAQRFPEAFQAMATLAAASPEAVERGDFLLLQGGAAGPSGARLLGRFCHADELLCARTREHLRAEEALHPEAVFAEIVHLPQGRIGNILSRPVMRDYEIPFLGRSGADDEHQLPVTDLLVSVRGNQIVLRSRRLGREIVPRLTSAHNFAMRSLGLYRFLCTIQSQEMLGGVAWNWGPLDGAPFLPRVVHGRLVLSRAAWWMTKDEIKALAKAQGEARYAAVQEWRQRRRLPRLMLLSDGDNELLVDLDNTLSIDAFLDVIEERDRARLHEMFPPADALLARGPEGRFVHELVIPYHRKSLPAAAPAHAVPGGDPARDYGAPRPPEAPQQQAPRPQVAAAAGEAPEQAPPAAAASTVSGPAAAAAAAAAGEAGEAGAGEATSAAAAMRDEAEPGAPATAGANGRPPVRRTFPPGSEWLYAKLYTGTATADRVLREVVAPLVREAREGGLADRWFFIRYADPEWHVRLRFHGDPAALAARILPALHAGAAPLLDDGRLWKLQLDTYEREIERYGGPLGIDPAERLFQADSEAVMDILDMLEGDEGADLRWRLTFYGVDALLNDLGLDAEAKLAVLSRMRQGFAQEFAGSGDEAAKALQVQLDQKFRTERPKLDPLLDAGGDADNPLAPALQVLAERSRRIAPEIAALRQLQQEGRLHGTLQEMAPSLAHMHVNRFIRSAARAHEMVLYDFLFQTHRSRAARARKRAAQGG